MKKFVTHSAEETMDLAAEFAKDFCGGEVVLLSGDLGAGKTVFAKGIAKALGVTQHVKSPTFTLCCEYKGEKLIFRHFDAYRLSSGREAEAAGLNEHFGNKNCVCVLEWPEQIESVLPKTALKVGIVTINENTKEITVYDE